MMLKVIAILGVALKKFCQAALEPVCRLVWQGQLELLKSFLERLSALAQEGKQCWAALSQHF
jgi:hypothetical protein